eukprot:scaffold193309_cov29-Tisochrysis_lutea.AAC.1
MGIAHITSSILVDFRHRTLRTLCSPSLSTFASMCADRDLIRATAAAAVTSSHVQPARALDVARPRMVEVKGGEGRGEW